MHILHFKPYQTIFPLHFLLSKKCTFLTLNIALLDTLYYTLNMMYNDYHKLFQEDTNKYVELALMWLEDEDSDGGDIKTYRYAVYV